MALNPTQPSSAIPAPVLSRTVPEQARTSAPLMPPFVPGRAPAAPAPSENGTPATPAPAPAAEAAPMPWEEPAAAPAPAPVMPWEEAAPAAEPAPEAADEEMWPLLTEEGSAGPAWDDGEEVEGGPAEFPLDAFIIPEHSKSLPSGYETEHGPLSERIAARLDELAREIRMNGLGQLGDVPGADELTRLIAGVVAGYLGRGGDA